MNNRPTGRNKNVTGQGNGIKRRGPGIGSGPVGRPDVHSSGGSFGRSSSSPFGTKPVYTSSYSSQTRSSGGGRGIIIAVIAIIVLLVGGGSFGFSTLFGTEGNGGYTIENGWGLASDAASSGWTKTSNNGKLNTSVADGVRDRYTTIVGNGRDTVTVMVYLCGTDLESKSGMASADLSEMSSATLSDKVNVIVYTGGCNSWKNDIISSGANQIYKVEKGGIRCLVKNDGTDAMTNPATLTRFIKYASENYPADRKFLIMWDHGAGSISGFGYDEKNAGAGAMSLSGIDRALTDAGVKFDAVGFDACLMATYENALMLERHADYLIASEETEPGIGWYYTDWLTHLSKNSSLSTVELGREIADDFVKTCSQKCPGQKATLSVIDLAELAKTSPDAFRTFAAEAAELCGGDDYQKISDARASSRSFALSAKKDMVDLAHLGYNIGTDNAVSMADTLVNAVKYNRTSSNMANSYGISIYFPYQKVSGVESAVKTYEALGVDEEYTKCIRSFASLEIAGQEVSGGTSSPFSSIVGSFSGQSPISASGVSDIFSSLLAGSTSIDGLSGLTSFFGRDLNRESAVSYIADHQFDSSALTWESRGTKYVMSLPEEQWSLVHALELNVFYFDGEGYLDLGLDNIFSFTEDGDLIGSYDGTWIAIDNQPVAYYHEETLTINNEVYTTGYVPVLLNGERAELLISFDPSNENGAIAGARRVYKDGETETVAKSVAALETGDRIEFICDYYKSVGTSAGDAVYDDTYVIAQMTYTGSHRVSNVYLDSSDYIASYLFTDMYGQHHWSERIPG